MLRKSKEAQKLCFILATIISLTGCPQNFYQQSNIKAAQEQKIASIKSGVAQLNQESESEWSKHDYDPVRSKLVIKEEALTFEMLANTDVPTKQEAIAIGKWANFHLSNSKKRIEFVRSSGYTEDYVSVVESNSNLKLGMMLELYHGRISYGDCLIKLKEIAAQGKADLAQLDQLYAQRNAVAQQQATALAQQRQQAFMQYLSNYNLQQQMLQNQARQQHGTVTCNQLGRFTTCNY